MTKHELAEACKHICLSAAEKDHDLWGHSILDLCADNLPSQDLQDLRYALSKSFQKITIMDKFSHRICMQILMYERDY